MKVWQVVFKQKRSLRSNAALNSKEFVVLSNAHQQWVELWAKQEAEKWRTSALPVMISVEPRKSGDWVRGILIGTGE